jgi:threonyl-tRNA synthetase
MQRIPYTLVVGEQERATDTVNIRVRGGETLGNMSITQFVDRLSQDVAQKGKTS